MEASKPNSSSVREWACISPDKSMWGYGDVVGPVIRNVCAMVNRRADGSWRWFAGIWSDYEPSRKLAQETAEYFANQKEVVK